MAKLIYLEADEEITAIVDRLREIPSENSPVLVLPTQARALQSPLNVRLLRQYSQNLGKRTAIVSGDAKTQALTIEHGFATFPTVDAWERGVEVHRANGPARPGIATSEATAMAPMTRAARGATAVAEPPPVVKPIAIGRPPPPFKPYSAPTRGGSRAPWIAAGALALLAIIAGALFLPSATVTLVVAGSPVSAETQITGSSGAVPAGATAQVQTTPVTLQESKSQQVPATGSKTVPATTASGKVAVTNKLDADISFPSGLCATTGQIQFRNGDRIPVPAGKTVIVNVVAAQPGQSGNVEIGKINSFCTARQNEFAGVSNREPTAGGADEKKLTVISEQDQNGAKQALINELTPKVKAQIAAKATGTLKVMGDPGVTPEVSFDRNVGDEAANFTASATVTGKAVLADEALINRLLRRAVNDKIPPRHVLTDDPVKTTYKAESVSLEGTGNLIVKGTAKGFVRPDFKLADIRSQTKGKSPAEARQALSRLESVQEVRVRQDPFGLPRLPFFGTRIFVKLHQLTAPTGSA